MVPFIDDSILFINELATQRSIVIVSDFNLDQILSENVAKADPLIQNFNLFQGSQYSTHNGWRIIEPCIWYFKF